jgi:hypothetical protein
MPITTGIKPRTHYRQHSLRQISDPFPDRDERPRTRKHRRRGQRQQ